MEVVTVMVALPEPETVGGLKLADAAEGRPLVPKLTLELNPPREPTLTVYVVPLP